MSVFNPLPVHLRSGSNPIASAFHSKYSLLAVASEDGVISIHTDEGESIDDLGFAADHAPELISWHPRLKSLVVGWENGCVSTWNERDRRVLDHEFLVGSSITAIHWSPEGHLVVLANEDGKFNLCSLDGRALTLVNEYVADSPIVQCVFATNSSQTLPVPDGEDTDPSSSFFAGSIDGHIFFCRENEPAVRVASISGRLSTLLWDEPRRMLVVLSASSELYQFSLQPDGTLTQTFQVRISGSSLRGGMLSNIAEVNGGSGIWVGPSLLAVCSSEQFVRILNLESDDHYTFDTPEVAPPGSIVSALGFNMRKRVVAASFSVDDSQSILSFWQYSAPTGHLSTEGTDWDFLNATRVNGVVTKISWGPKDDIVLLETESFSTSSSVLVLLHEDKLQHCMRGAFSAVQVSSSMFSIQEIRNGKTISSIPVNCRIRIKGLDVSDSVAVVWNGHEAQVFRFDPGPSVSGPSCTEVGFFPLHSNHVRVYRDLLYVVLEDGISVLSSEGAAVRKLPFSEIQGEPMLIDVFNDILGVCTNQNFIKLFYLKGREPKPVSPGAQVLAPEEGVVTSIRCNKDAKKVSFLIAYYLQGSDIQYPDSSVYVFDIDHHEVISYDFAPSKRTPISHAWDIIDPKLLIVETFSSKVDAAASVSSVAGRAVTAGSPSRNTDIGMRQTSSTARTRIESLYVTSPVEHGIILSDSFAPDKNLSSLVGVHTPLLYFVGIRRHQDDSSPSSTLGVPEIVPKTMRDFEGIELSDDETRDALMNFCFFLTIGNMDEAYRSVKKIRDRNVWKNMAQMCVKTRRMDVAEICLGNLENARGAAAVRESRTESLLEARVATLAIELGMFDEAEQLYQDCNRFDLLNKLYQAQGRWEEAVNIAETRDRIHLKNTHHLYGLYLEAMDRPDEAIRQFELAETYTMEVPRIFFRQGRLDDLKRYIDTSKEKSLCLWWAQYSESLGNQQEAAEYYRMAGDSSAVCRLLCALGDVQRAESLCNDADDRAAYFVLAEYFQAIEDTSRAITYFTRAGSLTRAIRLAMFAGHTTDVASLALQSSSRDTKREAAQYFEEQGDYERAIMLFEKAGDVSRAIDLCFASQHYAAFESLASAISESTDMETIARCADFFMQNRQFDRAAELYVHANEFKEALRLFEEYDVLLSEEFAEKMTPPKPKNSKDPVENEKRREILMRLATIAERQGSYQVATKKYTQAGENILAMKSLIRSGDVERIVFYAGVLKQPQTWILAANYLQSLNWRQDAEIMQNIISFYSKAKAYDYLANFYGACADIEIDDYQDYDKALAALGESRKYIEKSKSSDKSDRLSQIDERVHFIERYLEVRSMSGKDPSSVVRLLKDLLTEPNIEASVRRGDIYAELIGIYYEKSDFPKCYELIQEMQQSRIMVHLYIEEKVISEICTAVGARAPIGPSRSSSGAPSSTFEEEEVEEDVSF